MAPLNRVASSHHCPVPACIRAAPGPRFMATTNPSLMSTLIFIPVLGAAGKAFVVWLLGGSFGLAVLAFFFFKAIGK